MTAERIATDLLIHYFKTAFEGAGIEWTADNETEVSEIVRRLLQAAREEFPA